MVAVAAPEWIVCQANARAVVDGIVLCPRGIPSAWALCLTCRFLEDAESDRERDRDCSIEPTATDDEPVPEAPIETWTQRPVELL